MMTYEERLEHAKRLMKDISDEAFGEPKWGRLYADRYLFDVADEDIDAIRKMMNDAEIKITLK